jgi:hypothetical protein
MNDDAPAPPNEDPEATVDLYDPPAARPHGTDLFSEGLPRQPEVRPEETR